MLDSVTVTGEGGTEPNGSANLQYSGDGHVVKWDWGQGTRTLGGSEDLGQN